VSFRPENSFCLAPHSLDKEDRSYNDVHPLEATAEILDAAERLPCGATLLVPEVEWDEYESVFEGLAEGPGLRVTYDRGKLEIVSPLPEHEEYARLIEDLVTSACQVSRVKIEKQGAATWKRRSKSKGVEGDASYYIQNAERIIGKRKIDLESDPPPDIILEIDVTHVSLSRFPIYAAPGVPEILDSLPALFGKRFERSYTTQ
jgi:Uma2 family endonuclease